jgi:hypothetical protein
MRIFVEAGKSFSEVVASNEIYRYPNFSNGEVFFRDGSISPGIWREILGRSTLLLSPPLVSHSFTFCNSIQQLFGPIFAYIELVFIGYGLKTG